MSLDLVDKGKTSLVINVSFFFDPIRRKEESIFVFVFFLPVITQDGNLP